jgi:hypothetical protein
VTVNCCVAAPPLDGEVNDVGWPRLAGPVWVPTAPCVK